MSKIEALHYLVYMQTYCAGDYSIHESATPGIYFVTKDGE